jgi:ankyrin repeat protein
MALLNQQVNEGNSSKTTAFMIAVQWGNLPTVQILLQNGANPVAIDINGINSLMFASSKGHFDIVSLLLTYPININAKDEVGQTALTYANRAGS